VDQRRLIVFCSVLAATWAAYFVYVGLTEAAHEAAMPYRIERAFTFALTVTTLTVVNTALVMWHLNRTLAALARAQDTTAPIARATAVGRVYRAEIHPPAPRPPTSTRPSRRGRARGRDDTIGLDPGTVETARRLSERLRGDP